jgi:predicted transcriptional regulator
MKTKNREIESSSQADVLCVMEKYPETYFTTEQIRIELKLKTREKISKFLKKLQKSGFIDRKRIKGTNELLYKFKELKNGKS